MLHETVAQIIIQLTINLQKVTHDLIRDGDDFVDDLDVVFSSGTEIE